VAVIQTCSEETPGFNLYHVTISFISPGEWATANSFQILMNMFPSDLTLHNFSILKVITLCSSSSVTLNYMFWTNRHSSWNIRSNSVI